MANLLDGCAVLEELLLNDLDVPDIGSKLKIARLEHLVSVDVEPSLLSRHDGWWSPLHDDIPTFYNLTHMEISCSKSDWNGIVKCLQKCPKLETLLVHEIDVPFNEVTEAIMKEPILDIPQCLFHHT
ncbi:hypothetical protein K1719_020813 [Acacia pycnantha]|nr:hypothetical protein K1719_045058 [Acacia pycnantha]KAI9107940.1 hypothetical protein K1719_020813 [Acacia pycnantha]